MNVTGNAQLGEEQTMSGDKDHDSHRAGVLVGAGTGLLLLACCALPLLICCGLPLLAAGGALAGIGGFLGNPWLIGAGIAVGVAVTARPPPSRPQQP